jgi:signal transduction histidine kinase
VAGSGDEKRPPSLGSAEFDELLREVLGRVHGVLDERERWELLLEAVGSMAADLSLDALLQRIVEIARDLAGSRYAALGVLGDGPGRRLRLFITHGMTPTQVQEIGDLPVGHGLLGLIIDQPEPLRLHDIAQHPASYGFPPNHPPMRSFLGVPVRIRDKVFGNLYLTEKIGDGDFSDQDERILTALATAAGVAIENARLHEEGARRERWLAATAEITGLLSQAASGTDALQIVADRARELAEADIAWVVAGGDVDQLSLRVVSGAPMDVDATSRLDLDDSVAASVVRTGIPVSVEDLASHPHAVDVAGQMGWPQIGPAIVVPMRSARGVEGVLALGWVPERVPEFHAIDPNLPARFAEQAALAIQVARAHDDQQRLAVFEDRDRIGRDLHDLVIQRLFAIGLGLQSAARLSDRPEVTDRLGTAVDDLDATIKDIRRSIFALGSLDEAADIQAEVPRMVERAASALKFRPTLSFEGPVRTLVSATVAPDVLAVLGEALSNASRHARASSGSVTLAAGDEITLTVTDNGVGMPGHVVESGLSNMRQRAEKLGGRCDVAGEPGGGTTVVWSVPAV